MGRRGSGRVHAQETGLEIDPAATVRILEGFLQAEVTRTGRRAVVLGLSGGIDSAVACALAVRALGRDAVHPVILPHRDSDPASEREGETLVGSLGVVAERIDLTPMVDAFLESAGPADPLRLGNVMARARMIVLYDRSAARGALVLGTSNKTELLLGYGTLHRDLASALNPLGDLYKTQVRALAAWLRLPLRISGRSRPPISGRASPTRMSSASPTTRSIVSCTCGSTRASRERRRSPPDSPARWSIASTDS